MESMETENMSVVDEPEGGSIVQADNTGETMMLQGVANDGEPGSSGNSSWQWTSMLRLMEQETNPHTSTSSFLCSTAPSTASSYMTCTAADKQQSALCSVPPSLMSSGCFTSQSLLHDQPCMDMLSADQNAFGTSDPDVWAQEFLSGPIGEQKSTNFPCTADDGLQELLYPRTVLELLFSDQLKIDQMPSWPDILQAHRASAGSATVEFAHPMASEKTNMAVSTAPHEKYASGTGSPQIDAKVLHYIPTYSSLLSGTVDDRMSSSTASSTLSDNAIDQWPVPASSAPQCDTHPALLSSSQSMSSLMQQIDPTCIKQEHIDQPLSPFGEKGNGLEGSMKSVDYEQKPTNLLISKLWNSAVFNGNDPLLTHINHKHHIYESITAANFSQNLRQTAGMTTASNCNLQTMNSMQNAAGNHVAGHMYYLHQQSDQRLDKKPRSFNDVGGGNGIGGLDVSYGIHMHEKERVAKRIIRKEDENPNELEQDTKPGMQALLMETNEACLNIMMHNPNKEEDQGVGVECKLKRSRIEHSMPPTTTSTSSNNKSTTFKSQPMRKEKLSERITTLQQLVSPFGKTDTASVLLEAIGYIKFLQEQVQALSSPYLKRPASQNLVQGERGQVDEESKRDLRSRGLCLVPLACTLQVANDNGADYWYGSSYR